MNKNRSPVETLIDSAHLTDEGGGANPRSVGGDSASRFGALDGFEQGAGRVVEVSRQVAARALGLFAMLVASVHERQQDGG